MAGDIEIPLAKAIAAVRTELVAAVAEGQDKGVRFALGPIELEFQVEISYEAGVDAGVRFWVISIGGKGSRGSTTTHTIRLTLSPRSATSEGDLLVASELLRKPD